MKIEIEDVRRIAALAELAVPQDELAALAAQMGRIVTMVAELDTPDIPVTGAPVVMGPPNTPLREDLVDPMPLMHPISTIAPEFVDGLFLVPKLGGLAEE